MCVSEREELGVGRHVSHSVFQCAVTQYTPPCAAEFCTIVRARVFNDERGGTICDCGARDRVRWHYKHKQTEKNFPAFYVCARG